MLEIIYWANPKTYKVTKKGIYRKCPSHKFVKWVDLKYCRIFGYILYKKIKL